MKTLIRIFLALTCAFIVGAVDANAQFGFLKKKSNVRQQNSAVLDGIFNKYAEQGIVIDDATKKAMIQAATSGDQEEFIRLLESAIKAGNSASTVISSISMSDPSYEWSQFDNKNGKATMSQAGLVIESKSVLPQISVCDFSFDPSDPFIFSIQFDQTKAEKNKAVI